MAVNPSVLSIRFVLKYVLMGYTSTENSLVIHTVFEDLLYIYTEHGKKNNINGGQPGHKVGVPAVMSQRDELLKANIAVRINRELTFLTTSNLLMTMITLMTADH